LLRHSLSFLVYAVVAVFLYSVCLVVAQVLLRLRPGAAMTWFALIFSLFLVLLLNPLLFRFQKWVDQLISGNAHDPTTMLRQYSQSITNILDLQLLGTVAIGTASEFLEVKRGYLFLVDSEKDSTGKDYYQMRGVRGMGNTNPLPGRLGKDSVLAAAFRENCRPIPQSEIDFQPGYRDLLPEERSWMTSLAGEVYVPICAKKEWIGLLVLGPKASGADFNDRDLAFLSTMADQTAVALENTRLVEGLMRLNNEFRRAFTALDQANRHLEKLDKTKSDFISIASHELRTPLTLISGSSQMLMDDPGLTGNAYYKQLLSKIHSGTLRLHEIIDAMLDVAKIDARDLHLDTRPVALADVLEAVCTDLKKPAGERNQEITVEDLRILPPVEADASALRKVFYHLVINAVKFTPDGGKINIFGRVLEPNLTDLPEGGVEVVIRDTGIGIDPRFQELIFVKFYQTGELALHSTGKTKFKGGGPGLGLAIANGIIAAHQGRIWVESPGYDEKKCPGSQFHVVLPLRQQEISDYRPSELLVKN
jgi:signal transduction histidine kinase